MKVRASCSLSLKLWLPSIFLGHVNDVYLHNCRVVWYLRDADQLTFGTPNGRVLAYTFIRTYVDCGNICQDHGNPQYGHEQGHKARLHFHLPAFHCFLCKSLDHSIPGLIQMVYTHRHSTGHDHPIGSTLAGLQKKALWESPSFFHLHSLPPIRVFVPSRVSHHK